MQRLVVHGKTSSATQGDFALGGAPAANFSEGSGKVLKNRKQISQKAGANFSEGGRKALRGREQSSQRSEKMLIFQSGNKISITGGTSQRGGQGSERIFIPPPPAGTKLLRRAAWVLKELFSRPASPQGDGHS